MKKFEIKAIIPIEALTTGIYHIEVNTEKEALDIFKFENFNPSECLVDSYGVNDFENMNFGDAYINYIKEIND